MAAPLKLETFEPQDAQSATLFLPADRLASLRQQSFDLGYAEGLRHARAETGAVQAEIAGSLIGGLRDIGFTHIEARRAVLNTLEPLLTRFVEIVVPALAEHGLSDVVTAQAMALAELVTDGAVTVTCAPAVAPALKSALAGETGLAVSAVIVADPGCAAGEVRIASPEGERHIDLDLAMAAIRDSVAAFYDILSKEKNNA